MVLLGLAIAPGLAICFYIFLKDIYNKEPKRLLIASFVLGIFSIIPPYFIETSALEYFNTSIPSLATLAFCVVALSEELSKFLVVRYFCYPQKRFDEPLDGIVYSVMVSMGFATIENINYVLTHGYTTAFVRMFLSVPAHATFGVVMGYFIGKAKFDSANRFKHLFTGLLLAVLFHGTFDFFIFLQANEAINEYASDALLFAGAVASYLVAIWLSRKHIRVHHLHSRELFKPGQDV